MPWSHYISLQENFLESWQIYYTVFSPRDHVLYLLVASESLLTCSTDPIFLSSLAIVLGDITNFPTAHDCTPLSFFWQILELGSECLSWKGSSQHQVPIFPSSGICICHQGRKMPAPLILFLVSAAGYQTHQKRGGAHAPKVLGSPDTAPHILGSAMSQGICNLRNPLYDNVTEDRIHTQMPAWSFAWSWGLFFSFPISIWGACSFITDLTLRGWVIST